MVLSGAAGLEARVDLSHDLVRHEPSDVAAREDDVAEQVAGGLVHAEVDGDALRATGRHGGVAATVARSVMTKRTETARMKNLLGWRGRNSFVPAASRDKHEL